MIAGVPPNGEQVDFELKVENWSIYDIKDKLPVRLKARIILNKIIRTDLKDQVGSPVYAPGTTNPIFVTFALIELRQEPTMPQPTAEQLGSAPKVELEFTVKEEPWNEYRLPDGTILRTRISVTGVMKTPFYGLDGDPIYIINHSSAGRVIPKSVSTNQP